MGKSYKLGLTIERINNDGDYCKENCRWATHQEQMNNTRNNNVWEFEGEKKTTKQWSRKTGLNYSTLQERLMILKWPIEKALNTPARFIKRRTISAVGESEE